VAPQRLSDLGTVSSPGEWFHALGVPMIYVAEVRMAAARLADA
jgi:hypothetical protein